MLCLVWIQGQPKSEQNNGKHSRVTSFESCIILSSSSDFMAGRVGLRTGKEEKEKKVASNLLLMFGCLCICFVFLYRFQRALLKSQTNLWPGSCEWSFTPTVLWKQTQAQGQVLLLSQKFFPTSSILPLALISTALIWDLLSQLVKELFNYDFLTILGGVGREWKRKRKVEGAEMKSPTYLYPQLLEASSNDPLSFVIFQLFLTLQIPE